MDVLEGWKSHESELRNWCEAFKLVVLVQSSYAGSERVILNNSFSSQQESSLEDYNVIQLSVMLQYNYCC